MRKVIDVQYDQTIGMTGEARVLMEIAAGSSTSEDVLEAVSSGLGSRIIDSFVGLDPASR